MRLKTFLIFVWLLGSGVFYYFLTVDPAPQKISVIIKNVVDGDTVTLADNSKVRLLGINTPEKKMSYYSEAKDFLTMHVNGTRVDIEIAGTDQYRRTLAHLFKNGVHINKLLLEEGFATVFYYDEDQYTKSLIKAEMFARENQKGLWKKSQNNHCLKLIDLQFKESPKRCTNTEQLTLKNLCDFALNITFKDNANHIFNDVVLAQSVFSKNFSCTFNDAGDSLYVWDDGGLLLFYRY